MSNPDNRRPRFRSTAAPTLGLALITGLLLAGCGGSAGSDSSTEPAATSTSSPAQEENPATDPSDPSASTADSNGVDSQTSTSIEDSVAEAEKLLNELDQEFTQDDAETG